MSTLKSLKDKERLNIASNKRKEALSKCLDTVL